MCLAVPGKVLAIAGSDLLRTARVSFGGIEKDISLAFLPNVAVDDYVLVHAGVALSRIDEHEARQVLQTVREMETLAAVLGDEQ